MNGVGFARVGDTVGKHQTVLSLDEVLDQFQHGAVKEPLLGGELREHPGEGEGVLGFVQAIQLGLVGVRVFGSDGRHHVLVFHLNTALRDTILKFGSV